MRHTQFDPVGPDAKAKAPQPKAAPFTTRLRSALDPDPTASMGWSDAVGQLGLIALAACLYFLVRDLTKDQAALALANAESLLRLEATLGLDFEAAAQALILDYDWIIALFNWVYIYGHWPVIVSTMVYTFLYSRREYLMFRDAIIFSGAIGLVFFVLYPVAPPRLADPSSFFDSLELSKSYKILQPQGIVNRYAALPSFHVGWNLLAAIALWHSAPLWRGPRRRRLRPLALLMPVMMMLAVVLTANHWLIDVAAGAAIALTGLLSASRLRRRRTPGPTLPGQSGQSGQSGQQRRTSKTDHTDPARESLTA